MSDVLIISGGGSFVVAPDEIIAAAQAMRRLAAEAAGITQELAEIDRRAGREWLYDQAATMAAGSAEDSLQTARQLASMIEAPAMALHHALNLAMEGYGLAELSAEQLARDVTGSIAGIAGFVLGRAPWLPVLAGPMLPVVGGAASAAALGLMLRHGGPEGAANAVVSDPAFVSMVRLLVSSADEATLGVLGVPPFLTGALGEDGLGVVKMSTVAGGLLLGGSLVGLTRETPVRLRNHTPPVPVSAPAGFEDRAGRIPQPQAGDAEQVVIEKHSTPGQPDRFEVFISGTVTWDVGDSTEPWDTTSNLGNAAGGPAASEAAVRAAMAEAGVKPDSPVILTGYSQGGAVAALLAASGDYNVRGVLSFGGNTGNVRIPDHIPTVLVEHTDDLVPAAGGVQRNAHATLVERQAMAGRELPDGVPVPAHHLSEYKRTAQLMDAARSDQLTGAAERLAEFAPGATVTRTEYHFVRDRIVGGGGGGRGV